MRRSWESPWRNCSMKRNKELYTASELSEILRVPIDTIWRWGREGKLKRIKIGRLVRFELPERNQG